MCFPPYPRSRGELLMVKRFHQFTDDPPPHARGKRSQDFITGVRTRLTPALAGKTKSRMHRSAMATSHPRTRGENNKRQQHNCCCCASPPHSRGENILVATLSLAQVDLPPHSRGKPEAVNIKRCAACLTPARAGKTSRRQIRSFVPSSHPRTRGENTARARRLPILIASPPHARGKRRG